ncbi:NAD(P)-binding protein [Martensiomyces pterosporus]|nr:NAD(P)-binding protein [Martensiomyces pterosporus]
MTLLDIQGKVAVVTGAAQGIGLLTAQTLAKKGVKVVIGDIDPSGADEAAKINQAAGSQVAVFQLCDVRDGNSFQALLDRAISEFGQLDILVNNAGVLDRPWYLDPTGEYTTRCIDVNVRGLIDGTVRALRYWGQEEERKGIVINMASLAGYMPVEIMAAYSATKAAVVMYTKALAGLAPKIRVNAVAPFLVDTKFLDVDYMKSMGDMIKPVGLYQPGDVVPQVVRLIEDESFAGDVILLGPAQEPQVCKAPKSTDTDAKLAGVIAAAANAKK